MAVLLKDDPGIEFVFFKHNVTIEIFLQMFIK